MRRALVVAAVLAISSILAPRAARATNVEEFPDNGSEQEGRGGAWVARASDPLATFYNPAGLAGQPTRLTLQANISTQSTCFTRTKAASDTTQDGTTAGSNYPQTCSSGSFFPDPQLAFTYRLTDRIGLGIAILAPSAVGNVSWPEFVNGQPAPQRYLLISSNTVVLTPTIGIGWEAVDGLRLGASFIFGTAPNLDFINAAPAQNASGQVASTNDVRNELQASQAFIPGFTLGAIWSPSPELDIAAWYKWMADINAKGDLITANPYFTNAVAGGNTSGVVYGDTSQPYCYTLPSTGPLPNTSPVCGSGNNASVKVPFPMEAKLGLRYHKLRGDGPADAHLRDPIAQDVFDVEADFTWANNSAFDNLQVRFPGDASGNGIIPANPGLPLGSAFIPANADIRHHFRDVFGVRVGGDYNVVPNRLAIRAGGFFESKAADSQYQNLDFDGAARFGLALGATYKIPLGAEKRQALELMLAYGHVFFATLDYNNPNSPGGVPATAGLPCLNGGAQNPDGSCKNGGQAYRTPWPVNLGTITSSINVINVGASYRF
jgi:long-chain fatty acid transport protein